MPGVSWQLQDHNDENLGFYQNGTLKGYIEDDGGTLETRMNFTGQHRCSIKDIPYSNINYIGRIVCSNQNTYISMSNTIKKGNQAINQNESLPYVSVSNKMNDKSCFGVISSGEDPNERIDRYGVFLPLMKKKKETPVFTLIQLVRVLFGLLIKMDHLKQEIILLLVTYQDMELNNQMIFYIIILLQK